MAVPAPAVPSGNAYTVHVAQPPLHTPERSPAPSSLPTTAAAAALLLHAWKVPVRMHLAGASPGVAALREQLTRAGAKAGAFSPAPSPEISGEGFWKTTLILAETRDAGDSEKSETHGNPGNFWAEPRADKKVDWDPLLIVLRSEELHKQLSEGHADAILQIPDLWIVSTDSENPAAIAEDCLRRGAGAAAVLARDTVAWGSRNAMFGRSEGEIPRSGTDSDTDPDTGPVLQTALPKETAQGVFAAGIVQGMLQELLGENLFEKTLIRADRACLEARPLRLGRACQHGVAALRAAEDAAHASREDATVQPSPSLFQQGGILAARTEHHLALLRGPAAQPWGTLGRKGR